VADVPHAAEAPIPVYEPPVAYEPSTTEIPPVYEGEPASPDVVPGDLPIEEAGIWDAESGLFDEVKGTEVKPEDYLLPPEYSELIGDREVSKEELPPPRLEAPQDQALPTPLPEAPQDQAELPPPRPVPEVRVPPVEETPIGVGGGDYDWPFEEAPPAEQPPAAPTPGVAPAPPSREWSETVSDLEDLTTEGWGAPPAPPGQPQAPQAPPVQAPAHPPTYEQAPPPSGAPGEPPREDNLNSFFFEEDVDKKDKGEPGEGGSFWE